MQISLRSHLIAGTAAVVGAGAIAMNPVMGVQVSMPSINVPSAAQVALAAFDSPLAQLSATFAMTNQYLFNATSSPTTAANWPAANFGTTFGVPPANYPLLPAALATDALGGYSSVGLIPQFIDDALPILAQLGYNGSDYLNNTTNALGLIGITLGTAIWAAGGYVLAGNFPAALTEISDAVNTAGNVLLASGAYVLNGVLANAQAVIQSLVAAPASLLQITVGQISVISATASAILTNTVTALQLGDIEAAWNYTVDGLLGPTGLPGTLVNLSIGAGVQYAPILTPDEAGIAAAFVPSTRTVVQTLVKEIAADLATPNPFPPVPSPVAAVSSARSSASVRSAAVEAAPAAEAAAAEAPAAAESSAPAEKPVKERATRGASKRAAADN